MYTNKITAELVGKIQALCSDKLLINHLQRRIGQPLDNTTPEYFFRLLSEFQIETDPVIIDHFCIHMPEETLKAIPHKLLPHQLTYCMIKNPTHAKGLIQSNYFSDKFSIELQEKMEALAQKLNISI